MNNRIKSRSALACGASLAALLGAAPTWAQTAPAAPVATETTATEDDATKPDTTSEPEIVVTGSRAITNGANAPTPLTVVSGADLQSTNPGNLVEGLTQLPVFSSSTKAGTAGAASTTLGAGADLLSLRALGASRTLVLIDGRRVVPTQTNGSTDANLVPQGLIKRVDVVTAGASAAYGSDAVAGVVNFVLDSNYQGIKGQVQGGLSSRNDAGSFKASLTVGHAFLDDRLHVVASANYFKQNGIQLDYNGRDWAEAGWGLIGASTTSSALVLAPDVRDSNATAGGLITACQPTAAACPIKQMQFLPNGTLAPFTAGQYLTSATMSGGDGTARRTNIEPEYSIKNVFGRVSFDVSDKVSIYAEGSYNELHSHYFGSNTTESGTSALTIYNDNAYLPAAVRATMAANGITSFTMGRSNLDFGGDYGGIEFDNMTRTKRIVGGIDASLGGSWKASAYAQYGETSFTITGVNNQLVENVYNGADAGSIRHRARSSAAAPCWDCRAARAACRSISSDRAHRRPRRSIISSRIPFCTTRSARRSSRAMSAASSSRSGPIRSRSRSAPNTGARPTCRPAVPTATPARAPASAAIPQRRSIRPAPIRRAARPDRSTVRST